MGERERGDWEEEREGRWREEGRRGDAGIGREQATEADSSIGPLVGRVIRTGAVCKLGGIPARFTAQFGKGKKRIEKGRKLRK